MRQGMQMTQHTGIMWAILLMPEREFVKCLGEVFESDSVSVCEQLAERIYGKGDQRDRLWCVCEHSEYSRLNVPNLDGNTSVVSDDQNLESRR